MISGQQTWIDDSRVFRDVPHGRRRPVRPRPGRTDRIVQGCIEPNSSLPRRTGQFSEKVVTFGGEPGYTNQDRFGGNRETDTDVRVREGGGILLFLSLIGREGWVHGEGAEQ
jgi:hypothetical protein